MLVRRRYVRQRDDGMTKGPYRRKPTYMRSRSDARSDGFGPIKSVGVAVSFGLPLMGMGVFCLFAALIGPSSTLLWALAAGLIVVGLVTAASGRIV